MSTIRGYCPHFVYVSVFCVDYAYFVEYIHVPCILSAFLLFYLLYFTHIVKVTDVLYLHMICIFISKQAKYILKTLH